MHWNHSLSNVTYFGPFMHLQVGVGLLLYCPFRLVSRRCVVVDASDTQSDNPDSILGHRGSSANPAVHPSGVDKLTAIVGFLRLAFVSCSGEVG